MRRNPSQRRPRRSARAFSLVEVVAATALIATTLVSSMELIRDGMEQSTENDQRQLLAVYAVSQIEEQLTVTAAGWAAGSYGGDYAAEGHASIRYATVASDDPLNGGITGLLMDVRTTVYYDGDGDDALDADELRCEYRTKLGRFATYEALAP